MQILVGKADTGIWTMAHHAAFDCVRRLDGTKRGQHIRPRTFLDERPLGQSKSGHRVQQLGPISPAPCAPPHMPDQRNTVGLFQLTDRLDSEEPLPVLAVPLAVHQSHPSSLSVRRSERSA